MKNISKLLTSLAMLAFFFSSGAKEKIKINAGWTFRKGLSGEETIVNLPHTWNDVDFMNHDGIWQGKGVYTREIDVPASWTGKRVFLRFYGANSLARVQVNATEAGFHKGGFTSFVFDITPQLEFGKKNKVTVICDNYEREDMAPVGAFEVYGGLYRDVFLEVAETTCISPLYHGTKGIFVTQTHLDEDLAVIRAEAMLSTLSDYAGCKVVFDVLDPDGDAVASSVAGTIACDKASVSMFIRSPHLWNGTQDPYMYTMRVSIIRDGKTLDTETERFGLRTFCVDPDEGFFLNGKHLMLRGVNRHQEKAGKAIALTDEDHLKDFEFFRELGVNALRLSHYPHAQLVLDEADKAGYVVWEEIPFIAGYVDNPGFKENLETQLTEMILQYYNHPSICFWGLFNEVEENDPAVVSRLNDLAHRLDPTRLTTSATCEQGPFNFVSDVLGWNRYYGWYDEMTTDFEIFMDKWHKDHPNTATCVSEYGGGAGLSQHEDRYIETGPTNKKIAKGPWHPHEKQTFIHMAHIRMIAERPWIWGQFIWCMFDFASVQNHEGDTDCLNDKGLVSQDRKRRKDAFYLYKANWNKAEKTVHLCSKDYTQRRSDITDIIVFTTAPSAKLFLNGKAMGTKKTDDFAIVRWDGVRLQKGINKVEVRTADGDDSAVWTL